MCSTPMDIIIGARLRRAHVLKRGSMAARLPGPVMGTSTAIGAASRSNTRFATGTGRARTRLAAHRSIITSRRALAASAHCQFSSIRMAWPPRSQRPHPRRYRRLSGALRARPEETMSGLSERLKTRRFMHDHISPPRSTAPKQTSCMKACRSIASVTRLCAQCYPSGCPASPEGGEGGSSFFGRALQYS